MTTPGPPASLSGISALRNAADVLDLVPTGADVIVPLANGEPVALIHALDQEADRLDGVTVHQMHALHDHPYLHGERRPNLTHRSYFLSSVTRPAFEAGGCDLVPCHPHPTGATSSTAARSTGGSRSIAPSWR